MSYEDIVSFDLSAYCPTNETLFDGKGNVVSRTDTRQLVGEKALRLREIKQAASIELEVRAPAFKQQNAALGIYDEEKTKEITDAIVEVREKVSALEAALIAADSIDQVEQIVYA